MSHAGIVLDARSALSPAASLRARLRRAGANRDGRAGAQVLAARLLGAALAYAAQILAARYLGREGFGVYALALVWLTVLGHLSVGGTNQALCRYVAQALATGDHAIVRGFVRFGIVFALAAGACIGLAAISVVALVPGLVDSIYVLPLAIGFLAVPLLAIQDNLEAVARALGRPLLGIGPAYVVRQGASVLVFAGLALSPVVPSPGIALIGAAAALLVGIAVQVVLLRAALRQAVPAGKPRYELRVWLRTALPIALVDTTELLLLNADLLVVGLFLPPESVAIYFAATRIAQILEYVRYSGSAATAQRFAALDAMGRRADLHRLIALVTVATSGLTLAGAVALSAAAPFLLGLFGPDFTPAAYLVPILAAGMVVACLAGPGEDVLTMLGQERVCALSFALALVLNLGLLVMLIPAFGLAGAAAASAATMACRSLMLAAYAYQRLGIILPLGLSSRQAHA
ncbi:lipopolysaccharide biosynthesis protein [Enterovirga aerilata]|uniref:Oligosaccharide flippase family protein n=1 Tax=Enterovirga aerilata TaxID=2730920 RepID=A0A849HVL6_9HYPH|nr:polysaccharide biosynthesis C-terminal domain-containing protein [Enterovirga sp. DB1703]NNM71152.1 oligosaccharide flippase family protein [Enterovirga sp. DB1703]